MVNKGPSSNNWGRLARSSYINYATSNTTTTYYKRRHNKQMTVRNFHHSKSNSFLVLTFTIFLPQSIINFPFLFPKICETKGWPFTIFFSLLDLSSFYGLWDPHPSPLWRTNTFYFYCNPWHYCLFYKDIYYFLVSQGTVQDITLLISHTLILSMRFQMCVYQSIYLV